MIPNLDDNINSSKNIDDLLEIRKGKKEKNKDFSVMVKQNQEKINMSDNYLGLIRDCGTFLEYISDRNLEHFKLTNANFCKHRFCPHCSYNKSIKDAIKLSVLVKYLKSLGYKFIFLTLTAPNVKANELKKELEDYRIAFNEMFKIKAIKKISKGYIRKLELTYNVEKDSYHPHYHILIAVNKSYFTDKKIYLSRDKWLNLWKKYKHDDTITQIDIRKFDDECDNAIFEITKYIAKDSNYLISDEVFITFYKALKNKKIYSFSGVFQEANKMYNAKKLKEFEEKEDVDYFYKLWFAWTKLKYQQKNMFELTPEEYEKYNS